MNRIEEYLKRRRMKQKDLAESLHCTVTTISRYTSGERTPNVYTAIRIAEALKADVYDVFPATDPQWIPVTERLPIKKSLLCFNDGEISVGYYDEQDEWWKNVNDDWIEFVLDMEIVAWMPLPEPYKGENDETD